MAAHHQPPLHKNNSTVSSSSQSSTNIVGVHYRVGKKLGEGSFGVLYEGLYFCYFGHENIFVTHPAIFI